MKIIIAPDSFKESLSSAEVADAIAIGFQKIFPKANIIKMPLADGGEGTAKTLTDATSGIMHKQTVTGPLGDKVSASFGVLSSSTPTGKTAIVEMAEASGLQLLTAAQRNPLLTTSYGTGQLIQAALDQQINHLIIGLGGSATNDAGMGMMQALGACFKDANGQQLGFGGAELIRLAEIDLSGLDPRLAEVMLDIACDVDNPLCGKNGAAAVYGPQKGASKTMVNQLDAALAHFAKIVEHQFGKSVADIAGAGAAGGMGAALLAFTKANMRPGIDIVLDQLDFNQQLHGADLVITGEGKIDRQTVNGKAPVGVARRAAESGVPVIAIAGMLGEGFEEIYQHGIDAAFSIQQQPQSLQDSMKNAEKNLQITAQNISAFYQSIFQRKF